MKHRAFASSMAEKVRKVNAIGAANSEYASIALLAEMVTRAEIIATLAEKYPKFGKSTMSMISHPERYGVCLTPEAKKYLSQKYPEKAPQKRKPPRRKKNNRLSVYVDDADAERVKVAAEQAGCRTMQEYLSKLIRSEL